MTPQPVLIRSFKHIKGNPTSRLCLGNLVLAVQAELFGGSCNRLSATQRTQAMRFFSVTWWAMGVRFQRHVVQVDQGLVAQIVGQSSAAHCAARLRLTEGFTASQAGH